MIDEKKSIECLRNDISCFKINNMKDNEMYIRVDDRLKKEYPIYNRLDPEMKKAASEIAEKYPYCTEHVAAIIVANGFNKEKAERQIERELVLGKAGF